jgi:Domain of unknown function (DUF4160)
MVTVLRTYGLDVVIYPNDHQPAHVHVFGDGEMKVNLIGKDGLPELIWAVGESRATIRKAMVLVTDNRLLLLKRWSDFHG